MKFYSYKKIDKTDSIYRLIIGERSNGKTYGYLYKVLEAKIKRGLPSAYIRRYDTDIKASKMQRLFNGIMETGDFWKIIKNEYDDVYFYGGVFYLRLHDDNGNVIKKEPLLYCYALNVWEHFKGPDAGSVAFIAFDEFCTRGRYLDDEFITFHQMLSTIIRNRPGVIIYLLANTVNKFCPHFEEFGIGDVDKLHQGQIIDFKNGIAIEYCSDTGNNSKTEYLKPFSNVQLEMLRSGKWEIAQYPHIPKIASLDSVEYTFYVLFNHKQLAGEIRQTPEGGLYIFFRPQTKDIRPGDNIIFSQEIDRAYLSSTNVLKYQPTKIHKIIADLLRANKVYYHTNEVGEIVRNWLLWQGVIIK